MMLKILLISAFVLSSGPMCGLDYNETLEKLTNTYKETRILYGVTKHGELFEVFMSRDSTFTILTTAEGCVTYPKCTCVMEHGSDLTFMKDSIGILFHDQI